MNLKQYVKNPLLLIYALGRHSMLNWLPDRIYLSLVYRAFLGEWPDLNNPKTFNEKIQWLKLHQHDSKLTVLVDKLAVKKLVGEKIGKEFIIPTLGVWDSFDKIDFETLPQKFVLKCTHDSGGLVICPDKSKFDYGSARKKIQRCLKTNYYYGTREWPYKNVPKKIIAEEFLEEEGKVVPEDYKVYCFNGKPHYVVVFHNRFSEDTLSESVYDVEWNRQKISLSSYFKISDVTEPKPKLLDSMLRNAEILAQGFPQSRIDFYIVNDKLYFGEITLYTASGFRKMNPESLDEKLGEMIHLK